jgi:PiT family inorganic phosphate transporter
MLPLPLTGGLYLGWALGANGGANVFGTAVASRIISFRKASILCAMAIVLGAMLEGEGGIKTLSGLTDQSKATLLIISIAAAFTVTLMMFLRLPISTSQAVVGAIAGIGLATHDMNWAGLIKVVTCWVATPIGAMVIACVVYKVFGAFIQRVPMSMLTRDKVLWSGLIVVGVYGSYSLGANNVANATGIFSGQIEIGLSDGQLATWGGVAIALGVLTYGKRMMMTVGSGIMPMDAFTAFVAVSAMAVTVHIFAIIGVPVSTSQAIVGAIIGVGLMRGIHSIKFRMLRNIALGWFLTPAISLILTAAGYAVFCHVNQ